MYQYINYIYGNMAILSKKNIVRDSNQHQIEGKPCSPTIPIHIRMNIGKKEIF